MCALHYCLSPPSFFFFFVKLHNRHQIVVSKRALCSSPLCHIRELPAILCTMIFVLGICFEFLCTNADHDLIFLCTATDYFGISNHIFRHRSADNCVISCLIYGCARGDRTRYFHRFWLLCSIRLDNSPFIFLPKQI